VWEAHPFRSTPIGEDVEWAKEVLLAGHRLAYVPDAVVMHSHDRSARYELDRTSALHARLHTLFGLRTIPTRRALARAIASSLVLHWRRERSARSLALAVAWPLGQYRGARQAATG
jgi:rhamnosyltransferase